MPTVDIRLSSMNVREIQLTLSIDPSTVSAYGTEEGFARTG